MLNHELSRRCLYHKNFLSICLKLHFIYYDSSPHGRGTTYHFRLRDNTVPTCPMLLINSTCAKVLYFIWSLLSLSFVWYCSMCSCRAGWWMRNTRMRLPSMLFRSFMLYLVLACLTPRKCWPIPYILALDSHDSIFRHDFIHTLGFILLPQPARYDDFISHDQCTCTTVTCYQALMQHIRMTRFYHFILTAIYCFTIMRTMTALAFWFDRFTGTWRTYFFSFSAHLVACWPLAHSSCQLVVWGNGLAGTRWA